MKKIPLTSTEEKILAFIREQSHIKGAPPTLREIQEYFGYRAIGTVQDHIASLERKGALTRQRRRARGLQIVEDTPSVTGIFTAVPVLGRIAAGLPVAAEENIMGYVPVLSDDIRSGELFALKVSGDSMIEAGIFDGDTAVIEKQETAVNGDIVAVWVDGETTLKEFRRDSSGTILLVPRNSAMKPISLQEGRVSDIRILGRMAGLYRKYKAQHQNNINGE
jgi:repressor LexA